MRAHPTSHPPRAARRLAGAALTVTVAGITAGTAFAGDFGNIEVDPGVARPGSTVTLSTDACGAGGSAGVDAGSLGGGILGLESKTAESKTAHGTLRIPDGTEPGNYAVGGSCADGKEVTGTVVVSDRKRKPEGRAADERNDEPQARPGEQDTGHGKSEQEQPPKMPEQLPEVGNPEQDGHEQGNPEQGGEHKQEQGHEQRPEGKGHPETDARHDDGHRTDDGHHGRHGKMPHGRMHTGVGGGSDSLDTGRLAGGTAAVAAAAGGVLYLRRRHRGLGS